MHGPKSDEIVRPEVHDARMTDAIVAEGLVKRYGSVVALNGLDLKVPTLESGRAVTDREQVDFVHP